MPLDFLLRLMRDPHAPKARRLEAAKAAGPFLHPKLSAIEAKLSPAVSEPSPKKLLVEFILPTRDHAREDQE
jgi:hypothetical protein